MLERLRSRPTRRAVAYSSIRSSILCRNQVLRNNGRRALVVSPILVSAVIGVERNIGAWIRPTRLGSHLIECRIEQVLSIPCLPFQPGVSFQISDPTLADHHADIRCAIPSHICVKRHRFAFAVGEGRRLDFCRRVPSWTIRIRDRVQVVDPPVDSRQQKRIGRITGTGGQDR